MNEETVTDRLINGDGPVDRGTADRQRVTDKQTVKQITNYRN